jgi:phosphoribosylformimino-5-aminoimidazole carboxamide ribotide isomerase
MTELIPVLDLMSAIAVSGKSGKRDTYKPLETIYSKTPDPVEIAIALKRQGFKRIYVADLDAVEGKGSNLEIVRQINHVLPVMLDWGVKDFRSFTFALDYAQKVIVATETLNSWDDLEEIFEKYPKERITVSVDIKDGQILSRYISTTFDEIKSKLKQLKPEEIILLDISSVGTLNGYNRDILNEFSGMEDSLILGGGITPDEIKNLIECGVSKFLVGTALHSGEIRY